MLPNSTALISADTFSTNFGADIFQFIYYVVQKNAAYLRAPNWGFNLLRLIEYLGTFKATSNLNYLFGIIYADGNTNILPKINK